MRFQKAKENLVQALKLRRTTWGTFEVPQLKDNSDKDITTQLRVELDKQLDSYQNTVNDASLLSKAKSAIERVFRATSPFIKNFLLVAVHAESVPNSLFTQS